MPNYRALEFPCVECERPIYFSVEETQHSDQLLSCDHCSHSYSFEDPTLAQQLKSFTDLCQQIRASEDILSNTSVAVDVGKHHVEVPYKLLLTRLNSQIRLTMEDQEITVTFRSLPLEEAATYH